MKKPILISRCFLGKPCRYDGKAFDTIPESVQTLIDNFECIDICPECDSGMPTPRHPSEVEFHATAKTVLDADGKVKNDHGEDVTRYFIKGAEIACETAWKYGCESAVLKNGSPSCGSNRVYSGNFDGICKSGEGVTAAALRAQGLMVFSEDDADELISLYTREF
jgi:uncharacterized protein YbbK (DUF523 family)